MRVKLDNGAILPMRAHPTDAGLDLYAPMNIEKVIIFSGHSAMIDTGVHPELPKGYVGLVMTRSSMNAWDLHCEGVIDADYRGSIGVRLFNGGYDYYIVRPGDKIAQLLIVPCSLESCIAAEKLTETDRGTDGFGSTGK